jgi:hypothetical protein
MTSFEGSMALGCRVCGWATLPGSALCVGCLDIREWSRVNRAFCDLLHRAHPMEAAPDGVAPLAPSGAGLALCA